MSRSQGGQSAVPFRAVELCETALDAYDVVAVFRFGSGEGLGECHCLVAGIANPVPALFQCNGRDVCVEHVATERNVHVGGSVHLEGLVGADGVDVSREAKLQVLVHLAVLRQHPLHVVRHQFFGVEVVVAVV